MPAHRRRKAAKIYTAARLAVDADTRPGARIPGSAGRAGSASTTASPRTSTRRHATHAEPGRASASGICAIEAPDRAQIQGVASALDGNAAAGLLRELFALDVTVARFTCAECGAVGEVGRGAESLAAPWVLFSAALPATVSHSDWYARRLGCRLDMPGLAPAGGAGRRGPALRVLAVPLERHRPQPRACRRANELRQCRARGAQHWVVAAGGDLIRVGRS